jgi:HPt (histidine-containing phosphotransfer) domain-containing protein
MAKVSAVRHRTRTPPRPATEPPIDLAHLARMTFGEKGLESEVLRLFDRQAAMLLARMNDAPQAELAAFAHTLKGSARSIGARRVATAAEGIEVAASAHNQSHLAEALQELAAAVIDARAAIDDLLRAGVKRQ